MSIFKVILNIILLALVVSSSAFAADPPAVRADLEKLQEQIRTIDKDLSIYKEVSAAKLDSQDKRLGDIALSTAQQANHLAAISNQTTTVGNYIAITSALITVLVLGAGFITYFSAATRAEKEARKASEGWFKQSAAALQAEIQVLREQAQSASAQIETHKNQIAFEASSATAAIAAAGRAVLDSARASADGTPHEAPNQQALETVRDASEALKEKPESQFTAADYYARGLAFFSNKNYQSALAAFEQSIVQSTVTAPAGQIVHYLFAKGVTLGALGESDAEIAVYDEIDRRFSKDGSPGIREQVAGALVNKGARLGALNKSGEEIAVYDEIDRRFGKDELPTIRERVAGGLFNKGIALGALGKSNEAIAVYDDLDRRFSKHESPSVRKRVVAGLVNKSAWLGVLGKSYEAIAVYDEIDQRFCMDESLDVRTRVAGALVNKGTMLGTLGKSDEEIAVYDQIDQRFGMDKSAGMREQVAAGLFNKGIALGVVGKTDKAVAIYNEIERRFGKDESPGTRERVASGLFNKGIAFSVLGKTEEAIAVYDEIDQRFGKDELPGMRALVAGGLFSKGAALGALGKSEEAITVFDGINRRFANDKSRGVRERVAMAQNGLGFTRILLAKSCWPEADQRRELLADAIEVLECALTLFFQEQRAMVLGNLGYCLFLSGRHQSAEAPTLECLKLGGQDQLEAQRADTQKNRVEPEDSHYEQLLDELWRSLQLDSRHSANRQHLTAILNKKQHDSPSNGHS